MRIELAPMESITTYIYRNALQKYYGGIDTYFSPFISTHKNKKLNYKELNDILPENNNGINLIPQVMTSDAEEFLYTSSQIKELGYDHINLNFGCPSGTVTAKGKGAGILIYPEKLERLLDEIFSKSDMKISVKTRVGYSEYEEWNRLLDIYKKFPLKELIVHPRIREDFYNGKADRSLMKETLFRIKEVGMTVSYNGDIYSVSDCEDVTDKMSELDAVMIGRGLLTNPSLACNIKSRESDKNSNLLTDKEIIHTASFKEFNLELMNNYAEIMSGDRNTLFKLKELWVYMSNLFDEPAKVLKKIQKCNALRDYKNILDVYLG